MLKRIVFSLVLVLGLGTMTSCTLEDRVAGLEAAARYSGAPNATFPAVATEVGKDIIERGTSLVDMIVYVGGLIVAVGGGIAGHRFIAKKPVVIPPTE